MVDSPHFDSIWEAGIVSNWLQILCFKLCLVCLCFPPVVWGRCAIVANGFGVWKLMSEEDGGGGEGGEEEQEVGGRDPHVQCRHCKYLNIKMWKKSRFKVSFVSIFLQIFFQILFRSFWHQRIYDTALGSRDIAMWRFLWRGAAGAGIGYSSSWLLNIKWPISKIVKTTIFQRPPLTLSGGGGGGGQTPPSHTFAAGSIL